MYVHLLIAVSCYLVPVAPPWPAAVSGPCTLTINCALYRNLNFQSNYKCFSPQRDCKSNRFKSLFFPSPRVVRPIRTPCRAFYFIEVAEIGHSRAAGDRAWSLS